MEALCHLRNAPLLWRIFAAVLGRFHETKMRRNLQSCYKRAYVFLLSKFINILINPVRDEAQQSGVVTSVMHYGMVQNKGFHLRNALRR